MGIYNVGLDVGSTTVKLVVMNEKNNILYKNYLRHFSDIKNTVIYMLKEASGIINSGYIRASITGSGGMSISDKYNIPFIQEVIACRSAVKSIIPDTNVAVELGGEDAKITYFGESIEQRMNDSCAGGTGAFIDQMASLLKTDANGLNELAKNYKVIYPIASRCGVFAKTDIQPLLNEGAAREDIAASIFQAVVNQTISGLAHGRAIKGKVAFLGGPLYFLSELRKRFSETLNLSNENVLFPENSQYFVAIGAAMSSEKEVKFNNIYKSDNKNSITVKKNRKLPPLFINEEEYTHFRKRHENAKVERVDINNYSGKAFLGIDAGSTTTKISLIDIEGRLLYSDYRSNLGNPLTSTIQALKELYSILDNKVEIANSAVTGYGEHLVKAALNVDIGEIETVAHYKAANHFLPEVDFILDIGGQDMKSLKIKDGIIDSIMLNEACSSGCGSFIESFANSLNMEVSTFAKVAVKADEPVDLGTRCTVFMNSKVKQAQKDGVNIENISAGIAVSVIKNALYKVIRIKNSKDLGENIVVQGGTFYNDAVLKAMENVIGKEVVRPDIAGIMGAYGAALLARENYREDFKSKLIKADKLDTFTTEISMRRCNLCGNKCLITINKFSDGGQFATGNRCEKGIGIEKKENNLPNLYKYKYDRLFCYRSLNKKKAHRGMIGIPRVLNMYEDYPFWFTFFTKLGYKVILSGHSTKDIYEKGMETIPSESVCYPGKLVHGHIIDLIEKGVDKIFYPSIPFNRLEDNEASNHYNCPIVTSYPETISNNVENLREKKIRFYHPFLPIDNRKKIKKRLFNELSDESLTYKEISEAVDEAYKELDIFISDVKIEGEETLKYLKKNKLKGIVLAGRPYHIDPEVNHGIPELINSYGFAVLSEDSISHLGNIDRPLWCVDQWSYHSRMYAAAAYVAETDNLELVQLNSFGCGLDAVTADQIRMILDKKNKIYTILKIDEINNLGAVKIRIRSLIKALIEREKKRNTGNENHEDFKRIVFTKEMKKTHTILIPQLSQIHFQFLDSAFERGGYKTVVLKSNGYEAVEEGLRCVNNDACYPAIITVGQILKELKSGKYDLKNTSVLISQTGGGCRATNYIAFLRKALMEAELSHIPVISFNVVGLEKNPGFKIGLQTGMAIIMGMVYGDLLMRMLYKIRPYEIVKGSTNKLYELWVNKCRKHLKEETLNAGFKDNVVAMIRDFDNIPIYEDMVKPRVGIVGEILVKFHDGANNYVVDFLESEGAEAVMPDLFDFFLYCTYNNIVKYEKLSGTIKDKIYGELAIKLLEKFRKIMKQELDNSKRFTPPVSIRELAQGAKKHLSLANQTGEGWFLTAEMIELIENGVDNILCLQPFACLPNHITGKGMIKEIRRAYPKSNIAAIDYDPGASEVNQINRIKLMLSVAFENLKQKYDIYNIKENKDT